MYTYFSIVVLGCEFANFFHWGAERSEQFHYQPKSGWLWIMMILVMVATIAGLILYLTGIVVTPELIWPMCAFVTIQAIYSIAHRHQLRKQKFLQQVAER